MLPEAPEHDPRDKDMFQKFVTWAFYAMIVLIGYGILGKFDSLGTEVVTIRKEMTDMNVRLVQIIERQGFNDKEINQNRERIEKLEHSVQVLQRRRE